jgi:hypothetical protein
MKLFAYFCVFSIFVLLIIIWKRVYFKPLAVILVQKGKSCLVSVRPSPAWFKQLRSSRSCFASLGNGFVSWQCSSDEVQQSFGDVINVEDSIYIFRSRFGRFCSVDLSDRRLSDVLKKYK